MAYFSNPMEKINFDILFGDIQVHVVNINKVEPRADWFVPEHEHSDFEIHIIPQGKGRIRIEDCDFEVGAGEFYITGPNVRHFQLTDPTDPMMEYCLEFELKIQEDVASGNPFMQDECLFLRDTLSRVYPCAFKDSLGLAQSFETIMQEVKEQNACYMLKVQTLLMKIIIDMLRSICSQHGISYHNPATENLEEANRIRRIIKYIDSNYKNHITIKDISKVILLSPRQIDRLMKKTFHQTFHNYLLTHRMHIAEKLLMNSSLSIEQVAYESGFTSHYYMYQAFKRRSKLTPGKLRALKS